MTGVIVVFRIYRGMSVEFCKGFVLLMCMYVLMYYFFSRVHIILSNFHNAEVVGGADMVIQDWTLWIRLGLSGQHSGSRLKLFLKHIVLGERWGHY